MFVLFYYALLCVLSSFAIIFKRKSDRVALLIVIVVFPDHTHLLFVYRKMKLQIGKIILIILLTILFGALVLFV